MGTVKSIRTSSFHAHTSAGNYVCASRISCEIKATAPSYTRTISFAQRSPAPSSNPSALTNDQHNLTPPADRRPVSCFIVYNSPPPGMTRYGSRAPILQDPGRGVERWEETMDPTPAISCGTVGARNMDRKAAFVLRCARDCGPRVLVWECVFCGWILAINVMSCHDVGWTEVWSIVRCTT